MKEKRILKFTSEPTIQQSRVIDEIKYSQCYSVDYIINKDNVGERPISENKNIVVKISGPLANFWELGNSFEKLRKILFEYGKRHIIEKLKDGTLRDSEELILTTETQRDDKCPLDLSKISNPSNTEIEIELPEKKIEEKIQQNKLAASIIEYRDNINSIFKYKYKEKILQLDQERNILDFFRDADSQEEFSYRTVSLANIVGDMNVKKLREITGIQNKEIQSIGLLEELLKSLDYTGNKIIEPLRNIRRIRQAYPVHTDYVKGFMEALNYFRINYPIPKNDFNNTWKKLLKSYLEVLKELMEVLNINYQQLTTEKESIKN